MVFDLGEKLVDLAASTEHEFVMCAPFAKKAVVDRVLASLRADVKVSLFTRWRPEEIAAGVSDTGVLPSVRSREGRVYLHDHLHAKYYRNENHLLLGSANLTATALGWTPTPNIELLVEAGLDAVGEVERYLLTESVQATDAIAREVEDIAKLFPKAIPPLNTGPDPNTRVDVWVPNLRVPSDLYSAYSNGLDRMTTRSAAAAAVDLAVLDLPPGLDGQQFRTLVGHRLRSQALFRDIDQHLERPRRFGDVRRKLSELTGYERDRADEAWQTMMRWMLEFLPERYARDATRHSEVMRRITDGPQREVR